MAAIQILDPNTNEWFSFEPVTTWYDGTPMTPAKADGGIYIEYPASSGNYYKRVYTGPVNIKWFDVTGNNDPLDDAKIQKFIDTCNILKVKSLYIPEGKYLISSTKTFDFGFNLSSDIGVRELICEGEFISNVSSGTAIVIGSSSLNISNLKCTGLAITSTGNPPTPGVTGIEIKDVVSSFIEIKKVYGFETGIKLKSDFGNGGISYNQFYLNYLHDNTINLNFTASGAGYINENIFYGGSFNHTSGFPNIPTYNVKMDSGSINLFNNNRFICPSFEDNNATQAIAASITGVGNTIINPRMENPNNDNYKIIFDSNSYRCNLIGKGFGVKLASIQDDGNENSYETNTGTFLRTDTPYPENYKDYAVLTLQNATSSNNKTYRSLDATGNEVFNVNGLGMGYYSHSVYTNSGFRWATSDGNFNDRGLFFGNGDPTINPLAGSIYFNNTVGLNERTLWIKTDHTSTGWKAVTPYMKSLQADFQRSSISPVRVSVSDLKFDVIAGKSYKIELLSMIKTAALTTGASIGFILNSGTGTIMGYLEGQITNSPAATQLTAPIYSINNNSITPGSFMTTTGVGSTTIPVCISGLLTFKCLTSGEFQLQFGTEVSGSQATLLADSSLIVTELI